MLDVERLRRAEVALAVRALEVERRVQRVLDRRQLVDAEAERLALERGVAEMSARLDELCRAVDEEVRGRRRELHADHRSAFPSLAFSQIVDSLSASRSPGSASVSALAR